jgi:hypothetical protein
MLTSMLRRGNVDGRNDKEWEKSIIREDGRSKEKRIWGLREVVLRISIRKSLDRDVFGINRRTET